MRKKLRFWRLLFIAEIVPEYVFDVFGLFWTFWQRFEVFVVAYLEV
jgi:hypothetical protein